MKASALALLVAAAWSAPAVARPFVDHSPTDPLPPGDYLTSAQIKALVAGKTLSIPRLTPQMMGISQGPELHYYAPHGTAYFLVTAHNLGPIRGRGTWSADNNRLCTQGFRFAACFGLRRARGGQLEAVYTSHTTLMGRDYGNHWPITIEDGDAEGIRMPINEGFPYDSGPRPTE